MDTTKKMTPQDVRQYAIKWLDEDGAYVPEIARDLADRDNLSNWEKHRLEEECYAWGIGFLVVGLAQDLLGCKARGMAYYLACHTGRIDEVEYGIARMEEWANKRVEVA